jgi:hypothetical protein
MQLSWSLCRLLTCTQPLRHGDLVAVMQVTCLLAVLPLAFFLGSQSQFGRLNPLNPRDYFHIARKAVRALRENNLKVRW